MIYTNGMKFIILMGIWWDTTNGMSYINDGNLSQINRMS